MRVDGAKFNYSAPRVNFAPNHTYMYSAITGGVIRLGSVMRKGNPEGGESLILGPEVPFDGFTRGVGPMDILLDTYFE